MSLSTFDLFKIGIGPSSSHTVGQRERRGCSRTQLRDGGLLDAVHAVRCELYGSLGATSKGHGSDKAVMLGLEGEAPDLIDPDAIAPRLQALRETQRAEAGDHPIAFNEREGLKFLRKALPFHPNGMRLYAFDAKGDSLLEKTYYSIGGGFVISQAEDGQPALVPDRKILPYPFTTGIELLQRCSESGLSIAQVMWHNELAWRDGDAVRSGLLRIWNVMQACVRAVSPPKGSCLAGFKVKRRASELHRASDGAPRSGAEGPLQVMDWINLCAGRQ